MNYKKWNKNLWDKKSRKKLLTYGVLGGGGGI